MDEAKYFQSEEFKDSIRDRIKKDTWGKGKPMIYMNDKGQIIEHWECGKIVVLKENEI